VQKWQKSCPQKSQITAEKKVARRNRRDSQKKTPAYLRLSAISAGHIY
jgi:hypothetical protein